MQVKWKLVDKYLLSLIIILTLFGIGLSFFSSFSIGIRYKNDPYFFSNKQIVAFAISLITLIICMVYPLEKIPFLKPPLIFTIIIISLLLVFVPGIGKEVSGAKRWITLIGIQFQPSELVKLLLILLLSKSLSIKEELMAKIDKNSIIPLTYLVIIIILIALEPDLSTAIIVGSVGIGLFFVCKIPLRLIIAILTFLLPFLIYLLEAKKYFLNRLFFINPAADPFGRGYHLLQSLRAFKTGGITGIDSQKVLQSIGSLPDAHTDFIFSIIAYRFGLIGCLLIIFAFLFLAYRGISIARQQESIEFKLLAFGITFMISLESIFHISVTLGIIPTTGVGLPFISFGGTSLVVHYVMIGFLLQLSGKVKPNKIKVTGKVNQKNQGKKYV